jgi:D-alanyl-D-alanine carboxypeptidase (penicillin-binding protein 5/6)
MAMQKKVILLSLVLCFSEQTVFADPLQTQSVFDKATPTSTPHTSAALTTPPPPAINAHGYYLQDVYSGKVLGVQNPDQKMPPASLTKLMTLYLTFEALSSQRVHLTDLVPISEKAWRTGGSKMFIKVGDRVPLSDLLNGVVVDSGNDACVALAEYIGGSQESFVNLMNQQAALLGMKNTHYMDATGLPDPNHYTTPHDQALLSRTIVLNFPQYYPLFSQKTFTYNRITQENRNRLLFQDGSVDGLKTGHTDAAGYCLISSAKRGDMRLISVLLGAPADKTRAEESESLLNYGFRFYETHKLYSQNQKIENSPVYMGATKIVPVGVANDVYITVPTGQFDKVKINTNIQSPLKAPINKNQKIGEITVMLNNKNILDSNSEDIIALNKVEKGNMFRRLWDKVKLAV